MSANIKSENRRLLESLEFIDEKLILEALGDLRLPTSEDPTVAAKSPFKHWRQFVALAACILLLSIASPLVNYIAEVIRDFNAGAGSGTTEYTTDVNAIEDTDTLTEKEEYTIPDKHIENAPYFIFSDQLEPISREKIDDVKLAWYQIIYDDYYNTQYAIFKNHPIYSNDKEGLENTCSRNANHKASNYLKLLFSEDSANHCRGRYYGTINGCVIILFNTYLMDKYNTLTIEDITISNDSSFYLFAYKNGEIVLLEDAYKNKWITYDDLSTIAKRHNEFNEYWVEKEPIYRYLIFTPELEPISDETIQKIRSTIFEQKYAESYQIFLYDYSSDYYKGEYDNREAEERAARDANSSAQYYCKNFFNSEEEILHYHYRYYGIINDCVILLTYGAGESMPLVVEIAGYQFVLPQNYEFEVYYKDQIITISQAYADGILNTTDIRTIFDRHTLFEEIYKKYTQND